MNTELSTKDKVKGWLTIGVMAVVLGTCANACFNSSDRADGCVRNEYGHQWCDNNGDNRLTSDEVD